MTMKKKRTNILLLIVALLIVVTVNVSCFFSAGVQEVEENQVVAEDVAADDSTSSEIDPEEDFDQLLESDGFLEMFNSFYYDDSEIKEVKKVEGSGNLLYILLETPEKLEDVEEFYKSKKVQSIWSRSEIFEESKESLEEQFLEEESENVPVYKFTYYSDNKDKIVNVLVKGLEENRSRIVILYWDLQ